MIIDQGHDNYPHRWTSDTTRENKRVIYTLNPETQKREVVGEWHFNDTDLSLCDEVALVATQHKYMLKIQH